MTELAAAEARLAAISLSLMTFLAMLAAALVLGAWGLMVAGLVYGLLQLQIPLWLLLLVLGGLHALLAALAWRAAVNLSDNLQFKGTRRQIESTFTSGPHPGSQGDSPGRTGHEVVAATTQG